MARFPLQAVLEHAERGVEKAAEALARRAAERRHEEQRLEQLGSYREEYRRGLAEREARGMNVRELMDYRAFLVKLDQAIDGQQQNLNRARRTWETARQDWLAARQKLLGFQTLARRFEEQQQARETRQEQKDTDEFARTSHRRGQGGG